MHSPSSISYFFQKSPNNLFGSIYHGADLIGISHLQGVLGSPYNKTPHRRWSSSPWVSTASWFKDLLCYCCSLFRFNTPGSASSPILDSCLHEKWNNKKQRGVHLYSLKKGSSYNFPKFQLSVQLG